MKISAGHFFELLLPLSFLLTVILSTWVLASARKHRFSVQAVTLWTLGTFFFPLIVLPLYLIARSLKRTGEKESVSGDAPESVSDEKSEPVALPLRAALPAVYLIVMMSLCALYFYMDWRSVDAHLARANQARVESNRERVIAEYRAALKLETDAHTHYLLGKELAAIKTWSEALSEFRLAELMGEPDDELPLNIAATLDQLQREAEAQPEYEKFLNGPLCTEIPPDERCQIVSQRLKERSQEKAR